MVEHFSETMDQLRLLKIEDEMEMEEDRIPPELITSEIKKEGEDVHVKSEVYEPLMKQNFTTSNYSRNRLNTLTLR